MSLRASRWIGGILTAAVVVAWLTAPAPAETIHVTDSIDAIPAPPGTLRWAIEVSNGNGTPDEIVFIIDVARIDLVAPLPALTEGRLTLGTPPAPDDPQARPGSLTLHGGGTVPGAISIESAGNVFAGLRFEGFAGPTILLVKGSGSDDNLVAGCGFFGPGPDGLQREGVRIVPNDGTGALPEGVVIRQSMFDGLSSAVVVDGFPGPAGGANRPYTALVARNWFGLTPAGEPSGVGNGRAVETTLAGPVAIHANRAAGPGWGFLLDRADRSRVTDNVVGVRSNVSVACFGMDGPGIEVRQTAEASVVGNRVRCSQSGVLLAGATQRAYVAGNEIGSRTAGEGNLDEGVLLEQASGIEVRSNHIVGNGGAGIENRSSGSPGSVLSCNRIVANGGPPILAPDVTTPEPVLLGADELSVRGTLPDNLAASVEMFGDAGDGPGVFQGTMEAVSGAAGFTHLLPVLDLVFVAPALEPGAAIVFDTDDPALHEATSTPEGGGSTSEVSLAIASSAVDPVYDVARGNLGALARRPDGGVDLGDVVCLAGAISAADLPLSDPDEPQEGKGFFYVARRRSAVVERVGTYDPAVCLVDASTYSGPRIPTTGDCGL